METQSLAHFEQLRFLSCCTFRRLDLSLDGNHQVGILPGAKVKYPRLGQILCKSSTLSS